MSQVILIYTTNPWHTYASRELIAAATTKKQRDRLIRRYLRKHLEEKPSREDIDEAMRQIDEIGQTQNLSEKADLEIDTETIYTNIILD